MEPREEVTWLQYYEAVKQGDLATVQRSQKNFRLPLTLNFSALELAAIYGHVTLVRYFLTECNDDDRALIIKALQNTDYECTKLVLDHLGPISRLEDPFCESTIAAIENGDVRCVRLLSSNNTNEVTERFSVEYLIAAFRSGSKECMQFVVDELFEGNNASRVVRDVPELWIHIALNDLEKVKSYFSRNRDWAKKLEPALPQSSIFDIAAIFGHVDVLEFMVNEWRTLPVSESLDLDLTMAFAIRYNRVNVVKYLFDNALVNRRHPYEYNPGQFRFNQAYAYLSGKTEVKRMSEVPHGLYFESWRRSLRPVDAGAGRYSVSLVLWRDHPSHIREAENHYRSLVELGGNICPSDSWYYKEIFIEALSQQNVEAALCLKERVGRVSCSSTSKGFAYHSHFTEALGLCNHAASGEELPSPIIVELALWNLNGKLQCPCGELKPMDLLVDSLDPLPKYRDYEFYSDPPLLLPTLMDGARTVLNLLIDRGFPKPDPDRILRTFQGFFELKLPTRLVHAARILTILQCCQIGDSPQSEVRVSIESSVQWFRHRWKERDLFLTEFLLAISANNSLVSMEFECLLVYFLEPEKRTEHFTHLLWQTQTRIDDVHMAMGEVVESHSFEKVLEASTKQEVLSLESICRLALHKYSLTLAAREKRFIPARSVLSRLGRGLPGPLREFLQFSDVYRTMKSTSTDCIDPKLVEQILHRAPSSSDDDSSSNDGAAYESE